MIKENYFILGLGPHRWISGVSPSYALRNFPWFGEPYLACSQPFLIPRCKNQEWVPSTAGSGWKPTSQTKEPKAEVYNFHFCSSFSTKNCGIFLHIRSSCNCVLNNYLNINLKLNAMMCLQYKCLRYFYSSMTQDPVPPSNLTFKNNHPTILASQLKTGALSGGSGQVPSYQISSYHTHNSQSLLCW